MAEKYSYSDVIIDPNDARVEIGKEYWFADYPFNVLLFANRDDGACHGILSGISRGDITPFFIRGKYYACLIRKKEIVKHYAPFDLSDAVVREQLWGKRIVINEPYSIAGKTFKREVHSMITGFTFSTGEESEGDWEINAGECSLNAEEALEYAHFYDETPCGRLVEEE